MEFKRKKLFKPVSSEVQRIWASNVIEKSFWDLSQGVTQSLIAEFLACKERARLGYREGWSTVQTSNALTFGTLLHSALEVHYKWLARNFKGKVIIEGVLGNYKQEVSAERLWTPEDEETLQLNQGYLECILPAYFEEYEKKDKNKKYLAVEKEFKNKWSGNIFLRGKVDIAFEISNEVWIMDHKTTSVMDQNEGMSFDLQGMFYILNWWLETNILPKGFVKNIIKRPALRKGQNETLKHFIDRVRGDVDSSYFKRVQMTVTKEQFEYWFEKEFKPMMDELCGWAAGLLPNYRNPASCMTRYGNCKFLRVCGSKDFMGLYQRKKVFPELGV